MSEPPINPHGSLLEGLDQPAAAARKPKRSFRERLNAAGETMLYAPWRTKKRRTISGIVLLALLAGGGTAAYFALRPTPKPDYLTAPLDSILDYTLLTDEFNKLPVEERLRLVGQLVQRFKDMDASDSVMLAAFAAGIEGGVREQFEENASRLFLDTLDSFALKYDALPADATKKERIDALEDAFYDMVKMGELFGGDPVTKSKDELIADARQQGQRDTQRQAERGAPSFRQLDMIYNTLDEGPGQFATPQSRVRITKMVVQMGRHLRGEDIETGEPLSGGGGG